MLAAGLTVVLLAGCGSGGDDGRTVSNQAPNRSAARSLEPTPSPASVGASPSADPAGSVTFDGVTVTRALDLTATPEVTSTSTSPAPGLLVQDLVVGSGDEATPTSTAKLHYQGVLYSDGTPFDGNFDVADPPERALGKGFAQGVGGTDGVTPMKVGGRRLLIFPAALGYGPVPQEIIPAHSSLVFVVDLLSLS